MADMLVMVPGHGHGVTNFELLACKRLLSQQEHLALARVSGFIWNGMHAQTHRRESLVALEERKEGSHICSSHYG